jgi:ribonuclease VapC
MVIHTPAVLAILLGEPERRRFNETIEADPVRLISAASYLEAAIIIDDRFGYEGARDLKLFLTEAEVVTESVTVEQAKVASEAYRRFGKGNHPAAFNFGDCSRTPWPRSPPSRSCSRATTSRRPISRGAEPSPTAPLRTGPQSSRTALRTGGAATPSGARGPSCGRMRSCLNLGLNLEEWPRVC